MPRLSKRTSTLALLIFLSMPAVIGKCETARRRTIVLVYRTTITNIPAGAKDVKVWLPYPAEDQHQKLSDILISAPTEVKVTKEKEYSDRMLYLCVRNPTTQTIPIFLQYQVERKENINERLRAPGSKAPSTVALKTKISNRFLEPDRLAPIDGDIKALSDRITADKPNPLAKVRAIYDYVREHVVYDKSGTGWGRGDVKRACEVGRGNCTDFHALFIALTRAQGIPAKFEIGLPIPEKRGDGIIPGYHCWAEFYLKDYGWIPVDNSEASKHPEKADYYFGAHDENRVLFTVGRDLALSPRQQGEPLNFFIYPYVEIDGKPFTHVANEFRYTDVP